MRGTLTIRPYSVEVEGRDLGRDRRLIINGEEVGHLVTHGHPTATLIRCLWPEGQRYEYHVHLNDYGESLTSIRYEPKLRTDDELRGAILRETKVHTAIGEDLDAIAAKFGISREVT